MNKLYNLIGTNDYVAYGIIMTGAILVVMIIKW